MIEDRTSLEFPSQGFTSVPLCAVGGLVCCVAAGPGGHALRVMFDTGTDPSAIDIRLAHRLALRVGGSGLGVGAVSAEVPFTEAVLPWLRVGDLTIRDLFVPALELRDSPFDVDVVLGYNVLRQLALRIDYRRGILTLAHPDLGAMPVASRALALPLVFFEQFPALPDVLLDGRRIALTTLDTGSNAALTIGPDLCAALGLEAMSPGAQPASGSGFGGAGLVLRGGRRSVRIGPIELPDIDLDLPQATQGDLSRAGRANIGNRLLARFAAVALDYQRRTLLIEPG